MVSNDRVGIAVAQPLRFEERTTVASQCLAKLEITMPLLVDKMNDLVATSIVACPTALCHRQPGPHRHQSGAARLKPGEINQSLIMSCSTGSRGDGALGEASDEALARRFFMKSGAGERRA